MLPFFKIYIPPSSSSLIRKLKRFFKLIMKRYDDFYWDDSKIKFLKLIKNYHYDLIIANDIKTLPLALEIAKRNNAKVYFDAHEYHPKEWENNFKWRFLFQNYITYLCKKYIPKSDLFSTVNEAIQLEYKKITNKNSFIILNTAKYTNLKYTTVNENNKIKVIHHGSAIPAKKIEKTIQLFSYLKNYTLDLMLTGDPFYIKFLKKKSNEYPHINVIEPVPYFKIIEKLNEYDIGLYFLPPSNFNNLNALPNKLFEFIQARLAIITTPNPEMKKIIEKYKIGKVSDDFTIQSMKNLFLSLKSNEINLFKINANNAAKKLNSEIEKQKLKNIIDKTLL